MEISDFYEFSSKFVSKTFQAHAIYPALAITNFCELSKGEYNGINFPVIFKQKYGTRLEDVLNTGTALLYIISEKMRCKLEKSNLTGWRTFDIKLIDKNEKELEGYYGFSITGRCGRIDYNKAEIIEKRVVPNGPLGKYYKGLYVGLDKWDGSDFFSPKGTYQTIISKKAADIINNSRLTNIILKNLLEIETPDFGVINRG